eukprot:tig00001493_g8984.t1
MGKSKKRQPEEELPVTRPKDEEETADNLRFEDPFEDELEEEEVEDAGEGEEDEDGGGDEEGEDAMKEEGGASGSAKKPAGPTKVFRPGVDELAEGETLEFDQTAYTMYHSLNAEWPCLSIDIIRDTLGAHRTKFPMTCFFVAGTQADRASNNKLYVMKLSDLHRTSHPENSDEEDDEDSDAEDEPVLQHKQVKHEGGVNRVRSCPQKPELVADWAETGAVHVWDISASLAKLQDRPPPVPQARALADPNKVAPLQTFKGHKDEGFAIDWSPVTPARLATGDCKKGIHVWEPTPGGRWNVEGQAFAGHSGSVEDLQWSPTEAEVFASCSADGTVRIWDARKRAAAALSVDAHPGTDANVISWNRLVTYLMASGADDGSFKIWDLRAFKADAPLVHFKYHTKPISSIEWNPNESSSLALSCADNTVTIWDLSLEKDDDDTTEEEFPPQLLFVHSGQQDIKEVHWHPQMPGVLISTAADGFNIFKPANI